MKRAWMPLLLISVVLLAGCLGSTISFRVDNPPPGGYGTLAVTVERPSASAASFLLQKFLSLRRMLQSSASGSFASRFRTSRAPLE